MSYIFDHTARIRFLQTHNNTTSGPGSACVIGICRMLSPFPLHNSGKWINLPGQHQQGGTGNEGNINARRCWIFVNRNVCYRKFSCLLR
jgi:hypothetical protein